MGDNGGMEPERMGMEMWLQRKKKWAVKCLTAAIILLAVLTAAVPGILFIMRRADAQVALGNAKSLRLALQAASIEAYAAGRPFRDPSGNGGVTEEVWKKVITDSKASGDFWVLQTDKGGYEVWRFIYQEGDFTVTYCKEPLTYEVSYHSSYIQTQDMKGGVGT